MNVSFCLWRFVNGQRLANWYTFILRQTVVPLNLPDLRITIPEDEFDLVACVSALIQEGLNQAALGRIEELLKQIAIAEIFLLQERDIKHPE